MSLGYRRLLWIGGSFVAALILLALVIPLFVDINRYHDALESQAEKLLGRDVTLGRMRLTLLPFPGVRVEPLAIASDSQGDPVLLRAESLAAHTRIFPLLRGEIAVASLVAHHPELNLHRYPDGRWNLPDLASQGGAAPPRRPSGPGATGSGLSLSKLRIEGAKLRLVDEAVIPGRKVTTTLKDVSLALDGYAPGRPFGIRLETDLPPKGSGRLSLEGVVALPPSTPGPAAGETSLKLDLSKLQPSAFTVYFQALAGFAPPLGSASGKLEARGRLRTAGDGAYEVEGDGALRGELQLRQVALRPAARGSAPNPAGDLDLTIDLTAKEGGKRIEIRKFEAGRGKTRLAAGGSLVRSDQAAVVDVKVRPSQVMAEDLATLAALLGAKFPAGLTSAAPISFEGSASGPLNQPDRLRFEGRISLSGVRYADPATLGKPIEDISGKLTFQNGAFKVSPFAARVGKTEVQGALSLRDFASPDVTLELSSRRADLDDLMALMTPSSPAAGSPSAPAGGTDDILARTRGAGKIRIDEGSYGTFRFARFSGNLALAGKVVTFEPVSFQMYGGTYQGSLSADLRTSPPRFSYRSHVKGVAAEPFLAENFGIKDLLAGTVLADLEMQGSGSSVDAILSSLQGAGTLKVEKGWVGKLNVMGGLAKVSNLLGEKTLTRVSSNLASKRTDFTLLSGDIQLAGGRATSNNLKLVSPDLDLEGTGGFTLQGMLDLNLKVLFSKELTAAMLQEGSRARYLEREQDRIVLPLTIKGPLASPTYGVDIGDITRIAARAEVAEHLSQSKSALGQLAGSLLGGRSGSRKEPPPPGQPPPPKDAATTEAAAIPPASAGAEAIAILSSKYEGGLLLPDLTLRGEFSGVSLSGADLKVEGKGGRILLEKPDAFKEIASYYATHDRQAEARIPFKMKIDGKKIAGAGDLKITITLRRADGSASVRTLNEKKRGL